MLRWEKRAAPRATGEDARLGRFVVGCYVWDSARRRYEDPNEDKPYKVHGFMPGIKGQLGNYATQEKARARLEGVVSHWLTGLGLGPLRDFASLGGCVQTGGLPDGTEYVRFRAGDVEGHVEAAREVLLRLDEDERARLIDELRRTHDHICGG